MAEEQVHLMSAQDQANRILDNVYQAMVSDTADEMRMHVQKAMGLGQAVQDHLDEALSVTDDPDTADQIEEAMHHLTVAMDQGDQALEASDEEIESIVAEMREHAQSASSFLGQLIGASM